MKAVYCYFVLLSVTPVFADNACAKLTIFDGSLSCEGEASSVRYDPVGSEPLVECEPVNSPALGPFSLDTYCDLEGNFHQDGYMGSKACVEEETAMLQRTEFRNGKCVGVRSMGKSYFFECAQSPCPSSDAAKDESIRGVGMYSNQLLAAGYYIDSMSEIE